MASSKHRFNRNLLLVAAPRGGGPGLQGDPGAQTGRDRSAIDQAYEWIAQYRVPVVVEIMLERVTNISMGTEIDKIMEFEELALRPQDAPSAVGLLD